MYHKKCCLLPSGEHQLRAQTGQKKDLGKKQLHCLNVGYGWQLVTEAHPEGMVYITKFPFVTTGLHESTCKFVTSEAKSRLSENYNKAQQRKQSLYILHPCHQTGPHRTLLLHRSLSTDSWYRHKWFSFKTRWQKGNKTAVTSLLLLQSYNS